MTKAQNSIQYEVRFTLIGIIMGLFLAALDQTIVSTALPKIVADLKGTEYYAWVTTSYLLTSTVSAPIFGRLTELFSRKSILLIAVGIFLLGSVLSGLSQNMAELILFRGVQGIGGGALFALALTTLAVLFPPRERGRLAGLFGAVFGLSSAVGPWLGGLLTDHLSWHWIFYINMPVGGVALWFIARYMPRLSPEHREPFDYLGAFLLVVWTVPLLLAFSWGGSTYPWTSPEILGLLTTSLVGLLLWIWAALKVEHPLFDLSAFRIPTFALAAGASFFYGPAFLGTVAFLPLYLQVVKGVSASASGVTVLPLTLGVILGSVGGGALASRIGRYKSILTGGSLFLLGLFLLLHFLLEASTPLWLVVFLFFILGLGLGPSQSLINVAGQNDIPMQRIGSATSGLQFTRQIGSTMGIAFLGTLLAGSLNQELCRTFPQGASCQPGAAVQRNTEGTNLDLDAQFKALEAQLVAALKGDEAAYQALSTNHNLSEEVRKNLVKGGIPAQFAKTKALVFSALEGDTKAWEEIQKNPLLPDVLISRLPKGGIPSLFQALEEDLEAALSGDPKAWERVQQNPLLPQKVKLSIPKGGIPDPQVRLGALSTLRNQLKEAQRKTREEIQSQIASALDEAQREALETLPRQVVEGLEKTKAQIKEALDQGIVLAEKQIFLYSALFIFLSLLFLLGMPNKELMKGFSASSG